MSNNYVDWELLFSDLQATPSSPTPSNMQMQRTPSIMEFQKLMKNDATSALRYELGKLSKTAPPEKREVCLLFKLNQSLKTYSVLIGYLPGNS